MDFVLNHPILFVFIVFFLYVVLYVILSGTLGRFVTWIVSRFR